VCYLSYSCYHCGLPLDAWICLVCYKIKAIRNFWRRVFESVTCGFCWAELRLVSVCSLVQVKVSGPLFYIEFLQEWKESARLVCQSLWVVFSAWHYLTIWVEAAIRVHGRVSPSFYTFVRPRTLAWRNDNIKRGGVLFCFSLQEQDGALDARCFVAVGTTCDEDSRPAFYPIFCLKCK